MSANLRLGAWSNQYGITINVLEKSYTHDDHGDKNEYNNMRDTAAQGSIMLYPKGEKQVI